MDNLTHTLIGVGLAQAGLSRKLGLGTTAILAVSSNIPDIDGVCLFGGPLAFLWRRALTHGLPGASALILAAAVIFRRFYPNLSWTAVFGLTGLGVAGHVFADLWNAYGVVLLWPFTWRRFHLDWTFIIDPFIWGIFGAGLVAGLAFRSYREKIWRSGMCLLVLYIGVCAVARLESKNLLLRQAGKEGARPDAVFFYPEPFGPSHFRGVWLEGGRYAVYRIWPFEGRINLSERLEAEEKAGVVEAARRTSAGRKLDLFFSTPIWRLAPDGQGAVVYGLGFRTPLLRGRSPFVFRVTPDGGVERIRS